MKTPKGWKRLAKQSAYRNEALKVSVHLSPVAHCWLISKDGSGVQSGEYSTERTAMKAAERS